ncbi:MAG: acyl-ACP--UDP-N-acetylglucosamine O-acyltransferase [Victivallales bacterium]|nr:acyl-ACP--UDP-N-acetylglucosamine O-acyltransferase [Victivallales bacterium]
MAKIHQMSCVSPEAQIAGDVEIGPFCTVGPNVKIGLGTKLISSCNVAGYTEIGENNTFYPGVSVGTPPQDISYTGYVSYLKIGNDNTFREGFTANVGEGEGTITVIGDNNYFMENSHVAHNCKVGSRNIVAHATGFSGFSEIGSFCVFSGLCGTHQFLKVGSYVMMSGGSVYSKDIPPYAIADGRNGPIRTFNKIGLKRNGYSDEAVHNVKILYKIFFKSGLSVPNALAKIKEELDMTPEVKEFVDFVESSKRGIVHNTEKRRS